ncbi:MAG: prolipoprotein diacylglyceryl transferase [Phycisphaerales bacterium]|jgi:phosphatidylglycerol:prolipoprotein diacylglycerol transferase|nr:prolipoprotein diacylglyceryl transferase [Phycisphaerales bacterium]
MLADSYLHQLNPFAIQLTDTIGLRWYGLAYISGFIVAWLMIRWLGKNNFSKIKPEQSGDFIFACIVGVLAGGRLGYGLFYDPTMFYTFSSEFPWWEALAIHHGGMSSHGGMVGVLVVFILWGRKHNSSILNVMDTGVVCGIPGLFFGRLANFVNGELWGKKLPNELQLDPPWWSVKYPSEITEVWLVNPESHETELASIEPLRAVVSGGDSFYTNLVSQIYSGNEVAIETVQPLLTAWYPSQLFQTLTDGPVLFAAMILVWLKPRNPGIISGWFLIVYGVLRITTEMYRQPDVGVSSTMGLSRGQLLSAAMIVSGVILTLVCSRKNTEKMGGFISR